MGATKTGVRERLLKIMVPLVVGTDIVELITTVEPPGVKVPLLVRSVPVVPFKITLELLARNVSPVSI